MDGHDCQHPSLLPTAELDGHPIPRRFQRPEDTAATAESDGTPDLLASDRA